ncbi:hypothetical protein [Mycobacterium sp. NPDC050853]|uniref:hypothetical protein n=1 Tax=Mycobacterium sp. NPDC050853 TaxID=3155160 RepID=UPI0033E3AF0C
MPSYDPGRGQPPLDQNNGVSIYNSAAPQPSQAAQPSQAPTQNQDGTYNRAANGEQQPINHNAPNNQQLNNNWQKLSDQLNQQNQPGQNGHDTDQTNEQSDQCRGPYDWGSKLPFSHLLSHGSAGGEQTFADPNDGPSVLTPQQQEFNDMLEEAQRLMSLSPTLVNTWKELQKYPNTTDVAGLIPKWDFQGNFNPYQTAASYESGPMPDVDLTPGNDGSKNWVIRISQWLVDTGDPAQIARFLMHEISNAKDDADGIQDSRGGEYVEAHAHLLKMQMQEEVAQNCGGQDFVQNDDFAKFTLDELRKAQKIGTQNAWSDAVTNVGKEWGKQQFCTTAGGVAVTLFDYYHNDGARRCGT